MDGIGKRVIGKEGKGGRERCASLGNMAEMMKRKRDELERKGEEETEGNSIFRRSKKTLRSPKKEKGREERDLMDILGR